MRPQPYETNSEPELVMREMLLHDVYDLPVEQDLLVTCSYCGESGLGFEVLGHQPWCIYVEGAVSPEIPS